MHKTVIKLLIGAVTLASIAYAVDRANMRYLAPRGTTANATYSVNVAKKVAYRVRDTVVVPRSSSELALFGYGLQTTGADSGMRLMIRGLRRGMRVKYYSGTDSVFAAADTMDGTKTSLYLALNPRVLDDSLELTWWIRDRADADTVKTFKRWYRWTTEE